MPIVVYHYVRDRKTGGFNLKSVNLKDFKKQIKFILDHYRVIGLGDFIDQKNKDYILKKYISLTFDDGVADHFTNVFPVLTSNKVRATFFPIGCVFGGIVPATIKMHVIFSKSNERSVSDTLVSYLKGCYPARFRDFNVSSKRRINNQKRLKDTVLTANLKQVLAGLPVEVKNGFIDPLFKKMVRDEKKFLTDFFMTPSQLKEMRKKGMEIGSHGYSHTSLKSLDEESQFDDIVESKKTIESVIGADIRCFSYPFGDYNQHTIRILGKSGFKYGVAYNHGKFSEKDHSLTVSAGNYEDFFKTIKT
ncbi:MAG: polysaccharide deacetylase family protein [Minisyncoccia bacterium]